MHFSTLVSVALLSNLVVVFAAQRSLPKRQNSPYGAPYGGDSDPYDDNDHGDISPMWLPSDYIGGPSDPMPAVTAPLPSMTNPAEENDNTSAPTTTADDNCDGCGDDSEPTSDAAAFSDFTAPAEFTPAPTPSLDGFAALTSAELTTPSSTPEIPSRTAFSTSARPTSSTNGPSSSSGAAAAAASLSSSSSSGPSSTITTSRSTSSRPSQVANLNAAPALGVHGGASVAGILISMAFAIWL